MKQSLIITLALVVFGCTSKHSLKVGQIYTIAYRVPNQTDTGHSIVIGFGRVDSFENKYTQEDAKSKKGSWQERACWSIFTGDTMRDALRKPQYDSVKKSYPVITRWLPVLKENRDLVDVEPLKWAPPVLKVDTLYPPIKK